MIREILLFFVKRDNKKHRGKAVCFEPIETCQKDEVYTFSWRNWDGFELFFIGEESMEDPLGPEEFEKHFRITERPIAMKSN